MEQKNRHLAGGVVLLVVLLLLAACGPGGAAAPSSTATPRLGAIVPTRVPPTEGPSPTPLPTMTLTPSNMPPASDTPAPTDTPVVTDTATSTIPPAPTDTPTPTFTPTPTVTPSVTLTPTVSPSPTPTPTLRPSAQTEPLIITLTWATTGNVDLGVQEPDGTLISSMLPGTPDGGTFSADANGNCATATTHPMEQVTWNPGTAPAGSYDVFARYQAACGNTGPVDVEIAVTLGAETVLLRETASLELGQQFEFAFNFDLYATTVVEAGVGEGPAMAHPIAYGDTVAAEITDAQYEVRYTFDGRQDDLITADMRRLSGDLDTYLRLLDAEGNEVAANDDAGGDVPTDSRIDQFSLPADGTYTLVATRFQVAVGRSSGDFELSLTLLISGYEARQTLGSLAYGFSTRGLITADRAEVRYGFPGSANDVVVIDMRRLSGDLDAYLTLLAPGGTVLAVNDNAPGVGASSDARINRVLLPGVGSYTIVASRAQGQAGSTTGAFEISLELFSTDPADALLVSQVLSYGEAVTGTVSNDRYEALYTFSGQQGDMVTITLSRRSGDLDAYLILQDAAGSVLATNDDAPEAEVSTDSRIANFRLPTTGTYTIVATRFGRQQGVSSGDFELTLSLAEPVSTRRLPVALDAADSGSVSTDGSVYRQIFPGDDVRGNSYQAFLTFVLPPEVTAGSLVSATLSLGDCTLNGSPFTDLGPLGVQPLTYDTLDAGDFGTPDPGLLLGAVSTCPAGPLNVTGPVAAALAGGEGRAQFWLAFPDGSDEDVAIDDVTFSVPQLVLEVRSP